MQVISSPTGFFLHSTVINSLIFSYVWIITPIFPKHHGLDGEYRFVIDADL